MEAKHTRRRWTYSEFARLPTSGTTRYEVIDGELVVTPAPSVRHQRIVGRLFAALFEFARSNRLGETFVSPLDVLFAEGDYMEPDVLFLLKGRDDVLTDRGVEGAPDLVVEVLSPSTEARDRGIKLERYRLYGVTEYWVVDPQEGIVDVWRLTSGVTEPERHRKSDTLLWTPEDGGETLEIDLTELFGAA